jgi:signal transduction histidine kinase/ActR/RegA family two-component response regulator
LPVGFVVYDTDTRKVMTNTRFRELYAHDPIGLDPEGRLEDVLRNAIQIGDIRLPAGTDPEAWIRERLENHRRGAVDYVRETHGRWVRILERKTRDGRIVGVHTDISELKRAQAAAEQANHAKSDFLSRMSHELRTPLNAILGFSQLLQFDRAKKLSSEQQEQVGHIHSGGQHLLNLINEVLDLSGIEAGRVSLSLERVSTAAMVADIRAAMGPLAQKTGIALTDRCDPDIADVRADHLRLRQILLNLVSNAIKYNRPDGSVHLTAERHAEGGVRFAVSDTGLGIPLDRQDDVFKPFQRFGAEHTSIEGTGIGLAIAKRLVEAMNGSIGFESLPDKGMRFWVDLPAETEAACAAATPIGLAESPLPRSLRGRSVLYVEDNPANLKLVERIIGIVPGMRFLSSPTPRLGLDLAAAHCPDVIVLDINLPEMSGYEVLARLQMMPETRHIPVLALSAAAMPRDVQTGLAAGFFRYLTKPLDVPVFLAALNDALESGAVRQAAGE